MAVSTESVPETAMAATEEAMSTEEAMAATERPAAERTTPAEGTARTESATEGPAAFQPGRGRPDDRDAGNGSEDGRRR